MTAMGMRNIERVEAIGRLLQCKANDLNDVNRQMGVAATQLQANWEGDDAFSFVYSIWRVQAKGLNVDSMLVSRLGEAVIRNSQAQLGTSRTL